jgi:hypothetical protein
MKTYRQNAHILSLVAWAMICAIAACVLFYHSARILNRSLMWIEIAGGIALLLVGPVAWVIYYARGRLVWIRAGEEGIVVGDRYTIPWDRIRKVERRRPRLRKKTGPAQAGSMSLGDIPSGCGGCGDLGAAGEAGLLLLAVILIFIALIVLYWLIVLVLIPLVIVPVLEVFAPFGDRIRIVTEGRDLVLRDLRGADEFVAELRNRVRVEER